MMRKFIVKVNGKEYIVEVEELGNVQTQQPQQVISHNQETLPPTQVVQNIQPGVQQESKPKQIKEEKAPAVPAPSTSEGFKIQAPMSGVILKILVSSGQKVEYGQKVVILEAMKMENDIVADRPGIVKRVLVKEGDTVDTGQVLVELD